MKTPPEHRETPARAPESRKPSRPEPTAVAANRASSSAHENEPFEVSTARLAAIVGELETGELPLEQALALFEEGIQVARAAQRRLDQAEKRVEELLGEDPNGRPITKELGG